MTYNMPMLELLLVIILAPFVIGAIMTIISVFLGIILMMVGK